MIAPNIARWSKEAKRKGKTPNLAYLVARDRQASAPRIIWTSEIRVTPRYLPEWFREIMTPTVDEFVRLLNDIASDLEHVELPGNRHYWSYNPKKSDNA